MAINTMLEIKRLETKVSEQHIEIERLRETLADIKQEAGAAMDFGSDSDTVQYCYIKASETLAKGEGEGGTE